QNPAVQQAAAQFKLAYRNLKRTTIVSPVDGTVGQRSVQIGQQVGPGGPLMSVVQLRQVWVEANFKEGQLRHMRVGQPVRLESDLYGARVTYHGRVEGFSAGTGSAFSMLPSQNAAGNWIKVVQRLPVVISLEPSELAAHPLRVGLSMRATVQTKARGGHLLDGDAPLPAQRTRVHERSGRLTVPQYRVHAPGAAGETGYRTVFGANPGAVAAPTAGVHFDDAVLAALEARGVERATLTLHVGAGTFRPVR
ncbi:S-adenosylmethionine:tRNA ribosyltransferase-isomerase, partial [Burkholderia pseudomallei]|uniref:S-adenosylmethionine:tRNA ribosyltransferase-isomerase n=1 Tax=Burkholderia pseudomallei TaxID=28450 RepID=UPI0021F6AF8C